MFQLEYYRADLSGDERSSRSGADPTLFESETRKGFEEFEGNITRE